MEAGGDRVALVLGLGGPRVDGHSLLGLLVLVGGVALLWWGVQRLRTGRRSRRERARRRADLRAFAAGLDDDNIRLYAGSVAVLLPFSPMMALGPPIMAVGMNAMGGWLIAGWSLGVSAAIVWWAGVMVGPRTVRRAFRLSRLLVAHLLVAYVTVGAFAGALIARVSEEELNATGQWWIPAAGLALLVTAWYQIVLRRRLAKEGRLRLWTG